MKSKFRFGLAILALSEVACQPVIAIGWREFFIVLLIAVFLLGPPIYRFFRRLENSRRKKDE